MNKKFLEVLGGVVLVALIAAGVYYLSLSSPVENIAEDDLSVELVVLPSQPAPPITQHMREVVAQSKGFQALVSYTDTGFEPQQLEIQKGQTVRFTNNSSKTMWISAEYRDGEIYPVGKDSCGQSAFDTCVAFPPHEIWEFTFTHEGTWAYKNNTSSLDTGLVRVR